MPLKDVPFRTHRRPRTWQRWARYMYVYEVQVQFLYGSSLFDKDLVQRQILGFLWIIVLSCYSSLDISISYSTPSL